MKSLVEFIQEAYKKSISWGDDYTIGVGDKLYYVDDDHKITDLEITDIFENPRYHQTIIDVKDKKISVITFLTDGLAKSDGYYNAGRGAFKINDKDREGIFFPQKSLAQRYVNLKQYDILKIKSMPDPKEYSH